MKILRLAEEQANPVTAALNEDLWKVLRVTNPAPVLFKRFQGEWGGACVETQYTQEGEIEINEELQDATRTVSIYRARWQLVDTYIHELCHRLTPGYGHDAVFATLNLVLFIRAGELYKTLALNISLYDFQDHITAAHGVSAVDAFAFIYTHAEELAATDLSADQLVIEIKRRWQVYQQMLTDRPKKEARAAARLADLQHQVKDLKEERIALFGKGVICGLVFAAIAYIIRWSM